LIAEAFGVRHDQVTGLGALERERYDIVANIANASLRLAVELVRSKRFEKRLVPREMLTV